MSLSSATTTMSKGQVFDTLNPEKYPGILLSGTTNASTGVYSGHAYRYNANGTTRYAIVLQTNAGNAGNSASFHYLLAIQR